VPTPIPARSSLARPIAGVVIGALLVVVGLAAIASIPRSPGEFAYLARTFGPMPFAAMRGFTWEQALDHVYRVVLVGPGLVVLGLSLARWTPVWQPSERDARRVAAIAAIVGALLACIATFLVFRGHALTDDELTYAYQASCLLDGRIGRPGLPGDHPPLEPFLVTSDVGVTGKYLFGEPLVQMVGVALGLPALVHPLLYVVTLAAFHRAVQRLTKSTRVAAWSVALLALCPMVVLCTGTAQSQPTSLACVALACLGFAELRQDRPIRGALTAGLALAFGLATRPQSVASAALVIVAATARSRPRALPALVLPIALGLGSIALYDRAVTGDALRLPWSLWLPEHYGFGDVFDDGMFFFGPRDLLENLLVTLVRLDAWWMGWPLALGMVVLWQRADRPIAGTRLWPALAIAQTGVQLLYYSPGASDVGPIYFYELALPLAALGGAILDHWLLRAPRKAVALLVVHLALGTVPFYVTQVVRLERLLAVLYDDVDATLATLETPALVLHDPQCPVQHERGWIISLFPYRWRSTRDAIVTMVFPPNPRALEETLVRFPERHCYYVARPSPDREIVVTPCSEIDRARGAEIFRPRACESPIPTATSHGF